ncbi:MAG: hypothetical protein QQN46_08600 [Nitrosopumilus sp.]
MTPVNVEKGVFLRHFQKNVIFRGFQKWVKDFQKFGPKSLSLCSQRFTVTPHPKIATLGDF